MFHLRDDQQVELLLTYLDSKNQPTVAENATVESSDSSVVRVESLGPDKFALVAGNVGMAQIQAVADARIGEGVMLISGAETIMVMPGEAAVMTLGFGEPTPQA